MSDQTPLELTMAEVAAANAEAGENPVKVGILTPMTPPGDPIAGVLVSRGARLGAEYLRERGGVLGGRGIHFVAYNDMATAEQEGFQRSAVAGMAKLAMVDEVLMVLGQWHLRTTPWVADMCDKLGVPMFAENGDPSATYKHRAVFRTYFSIADRSPLMMACLNDIGARKVAMLATDTVFGATIANLLERLATEKYGMEFLRIDFLQEETRDWRDQLRRIKEWGPDAFINGGVNVSADRGPVGNSYQILGQAIEVGLLPGPALMVTFGFPMRSADYWRMAGEPGNGVMWAASRFRPSYEGMTELGRWFTDRFMQRYGFPPPDTCLSAFTDITIMGQALEIAGSDDREALIQALENNEFHTWRGPVRFERGEEHWHHSPPELVIMQYQKYGQTFDEAAVIYPPSLADSGYAKP